MDTELATRIDRSIGPAPDTDDGLSGLLEQGHRAVRRRQLALGSATAAAVAVIAVGASMLAGGPSNDAGTDVVQQPIGSPTVVDSPTVEPSTGSSQPPPPTQAEVRQVLHRLVVGLDDRGVAVPSEGAVLRTVDNPFGVAPPAASQALQIQIGGGIYWYARVDAPDQSGEAVTYSGNEKVSFRVWLNSVSTLAAGIRPTDNGSEDFPGIAADMVAFVGGTEQLSPGDGVTILEQRPHVSVGDSFAGPADRTAAALVRTGGGDDYYVLARVVDGEEQQDIAVPVSKGGADLDAFLDFARERYASGAGLL